MKNINDICFIVQARLNSERVPKKMVRDFAGTTLSDICLSKIGESLLIPNENFYFSVFEPELKEIAERYGLQCFNRSEESANGERSLQLIYEWHNKLPYKYVVLINACAPFLTIDTIEEFIKFYMQSDNDGLFGVIPYKDYFWDSQGALITPWPKDTKIMNTKLVDTTYRGAHCLYAGKMSLIKDDIWMGSFEGKNGPELFPLSEEECFDIDYEWQFSLGETLYSERRGFDPE